MKDDISAPGMAWPTLSLTAVVLVGWCVLLVAAVSGELPVVAAVPLLTLAAYVTFTPMHDASHRSVSRNSRLNEAVGRLASVPLLVPFVAFRYVHLEHHRNTNEPGRDPDLWSGGRLRWTLPLRWLTQDAHYYEFYFRRVADRSRSEAIEATLSLLGIWTLFAAGVALGYGLEVLLFLVLPARLAIAMLAFSFDYLPHSPHVQRGRTARFTNTSNIRSSDGPVPGWLTPVLLFQNYHLVHHLYPAVPFYRYAKVWRAREQDLRAKGASDRTLLDAFLGRSHLETP